MSKRDDGGRRMKPMYRTAAEEALILAAIAEVSSWRAWNREPWSWDKCDESDKAMAKYRAAVRAVIRERGKKR